MIRGPNWSLAIVSCLALAGCTSNSYPLTKLADENTAIPGSAATFAFYPAVAFDGTEIAFLGESVSGIQGIYRSPATAGATITKVAQVGDVAPGAGNVTYGGFILFDYSSPEPVLSLDDGQIAFAASIEESSAIFSDVSGTLDRIVDQGTTAPPGTGTFSMFDEPPRISGGQIVFESYNYSPYGDNLNLRSSNSTLSKVVAYDDPLPGGGVFQFSAGAKINGAANTIVFKDRYERGLYASINGTLSKLADSTNTPIPPGNLGNFTELDDFSLTGDQVYFIGRGANGYQGIFMVPTTGGAITPLVDIATASPNSGGNFVSFSMVAQFGDAGQIIFTAMTTESGELRGVYAQGASGVQDVLPSGNMLDGYPVREAYITADSVRGSQAVLTVTLQSSGGGNLYRLYLADGSSSPIRSLPAPISSFLRKNRGWTPGNSLKF